MKHSGMKKFRTLAAMVEAVKRNEIPACVISPGAAAAALDINRSSLHQLLKRGSLPCWVAERVILIDAKAVQARALARRGVPAAQGDLYAGQRQRHRV